MTTTRKIIHLDLDAFFCAVEEQRDPSLVGKPFAVGGKPEERGVVASCSYAARQRGVRSAMPMVHALRLCPNLTIVPARHRVYEHISQQVMEIIHRLTPQVEQISIDEAFLDVTGIDLPLRQIASQLQADIYQQLGLPASLGGATNKLVAKIATDVGKAANRSDKPPMAITIVPPGDEAAFLAPLPVQALWGVGPKTAARLKLLNIEKVGDLAARSEQEMVELFGNHVNDLVIHARGIDDRPIITQHQIKSISQEVTFTKDIRDLRLLESALLELSESVGRRLKEEKLKGSTVKIKLRWPSFVTVTRQVTLTQATDQEQIIFETAKHLFHKLWEPEQAVRLIGVGVSGFYRETRQLSFWDLQTEKDRTLQQAIENLQHKFGKQAVQRGAQTTTIRTHSAKRPN
jgi:DNA polymerase-4